MGSPKGLFANPIHTSSALTSPFPLPSPLMKPGYFCVFFGFLSFFFFFFQKHKLDLNNHGVKAVDDLFSLSLRMVSDLLK